nr:reverse transcriptase domain-containing protein [Tanacetum cinerariifolium]
MIATLKYRDVPNDAIKLRLFPYSLEDRARIWYEKEPPNSILTWDDLVNKFVNQFFPPSKTTHLKNKISHFIQRFEETSSEAWDRFKELLRTCPHHGFSELTRIDTFYNGLTEQNQDSLNAAAGGNLLNKTTREALKIIENKSKGFQNQPFSVPNNQIPPIVPNELSSYIKSNEIAIKSMQNQINVLRGDFSKHNTIPNPKGKMKAVTTRSGLAYEGPSIPTKSPLEKVEEQNTKEILDKEQSNSSGSTAQVQPLVMPILILEHDVSRTKTKPTISFANALLLMQKFSSTIKSLLANKDKLFELANVPLNENCSAMLLKKLPEKLGDLGKFLIPYDFPGMEVCHALADLGESINLMPLSIWKKLSLSELTSTRMTLELVDRLITRPKGVAEDVFVKVGKFHFPTDFIVVKFEADPRVPLILGRSFLRTGRGLIDVYGEEITLSVNDESITFNLNQTMRYSLSYNDTSVNRVDVIDIACKEFVQDVLDFQYNPKSSSPTLVFDDLISESNARKVPIVKSSSPTFTPFGESDFFLEEIEDFLNDDSIPIGNENYVYDPEGDILFLEKLLNEDPFQLPLMDLKLVEESKQKSSVEEPPELELKELPSHPDPWVSLIHCVPKKGGMTVVANENNELILTRLVTGWREKTTFTCPYGTFAYRRMPFGLCNAPGTFQRCMMSIFHDMIEKTMEVFMDDFLRRHCIRSQNFKSSIEVDRAKVDVISKLPHPTTIKGVRSFLGHAGFYRRFIQDFSKIARPMTHLLEKETTFVFSKECIDAFNTLKKKLTEALILVVPDWNLPFELRCDASDYAIDFMGLFPSSKGNKYIVVAVDYLSKWVEVKALPTNDARVVVKFLNLSSPDSYGVTHRLATAYHPPASGQVEVSNHGLKQILERTTAGDHRKLQLNELSELRDQAYKNYVIYKERTKKLHDSKIKNRIFNVGDQVLIFNSRLKIFSGKLKTRWSGPFTITRIFPYGTIELSQPNGPNFKVNGHHVKHYFGGDIPSNVALDLHMFPKDN